MSQEIAQELDCLIRARYALLYLVTYEEARAMRILSHIAQQRNKSLYEWSITDGLRTVVSREGEHPAPERTRKPLAILNEILQSSQSGIFVLKDFHTYLEQPEIVRQLRDLAHALRSTGKSVIIVSPVYKMPEELAKQMTVVDLPLPTYEELTDLLGGKIDNPRISRRFQVNLTPDERHALIKAAQGLTLSEAENAFALAIVRDRVLDSEDIDAILAEKRQVIRKSGVLEYYDVDESLATVGGMDLLKDWLTKRKRAFSDEAREFGLPEPRGVLLMGVQGCGKSLIAKTIASSWGLPLLRMDMSRIFQGYIGSSEQNMRKAMNVAECLAPVVLWVDEIEKAFSGVSGSGSSDSGTTARVIGLFLTWLQEKTSAVFVVATANEVKDLPPELLRKGRLDEIFFVDLPSKEERREIFRIHIGKVKRDPGLFDLDALAEEASGFSGAEIEQAVIAGLHDAFFAGRDLNQQDLLTNINSSVPLSTTMAEKIAVLRDWARYRARPVASQQRLEHEAELP